MTVRRKISNKAGILFTKKVPRGIPQENQTCLLGRAGHFQLSKSQPVLSPKQRKLQYIVLYLLLQVDMPLDQGRTIFKELMPDKKA